MDRRVTLAWMESCAHGGPTQVRVVFMGRNIMLASAQNYSCSAPCTQNAAAASARFHAVVMAARAATRTVHVRNTSKRERQYQRTCSKLSHGCVFLDKGWRVLLPKRILPALGYSGTSAEIGVWQGHFSSIIASAWPQASGVHYLVDPYRPMASCNAVRRDKTHRARGKPRQR